MNLAPIRYARALKSKGGPVEKIACLEVEIGGQKYYQVDSYLSGSLNLNRPIVEYFGGSDGTGTDVSAMVARHKSISEAIERWAYHYLNQIGHRKRYGFDINPSTSGMAAYPGLFSFQARKRAMSEAVERYCLVKWWDRELPCTTIPSGIDGTVAVSLKNPLTRDSVVIVWSLDENGWTSYGSAADTSLESALRQAHIERSRRIIAMRLVFKKNPSLKVANISTLRNPIERHMAFLALPEGHEEFLLRVNEPPLRECQKKPPPLIDSNVPGPWQRYATVWRVVFPRNNHSFRDGPLGSLFI